MDSEIRYHLIHTFGIPSDIVDQYMNQMLAAQGNPQFKDELSLEQMRSIVAQYLLETAADSEHFGFPQ